MRYDIKGHKPTVLNEERLNSVRMRVIIKRRLQRVEERKESKGSQKNWWLLSALCLVIEKTRLVLLQMLGATRFWTRYDGPTPPADCRMAAHSLG